MISVDPDMLIVKLVSEVSDCPYDCQCFQVGYRIRQNSRGGKLLRFSRFLLNREGFPVENFTRLGIHYYKKLLPQKFSRQIFIFALTAKVFPLDCFDVYGMP